MFSGRVNRSKGLFDVLEIAQQMEESHPRLIRWEICGQGPDFDELNSRCQELGLEKTFRLRGWTAPADLIEVHAKKPRVDRSHAERLRRGAGDGGCRGHPVRPAP